MSEPLTDYVITEHAVFEIGRRGLTEELVRRVLAAPEQRYEVRPRRDVFQSRISLGDPTEAYLVRLCRRGSPAFRGRDRVSNE